MEHHFAHNSCLVWFVSTKIQSVRKAYTHLSFLNNLDIYLCSSSTVILGILRLLFKYYRFGFYWWDRKIYPLSLTMGYTENISQKLRYMMYQLQPNVGVKEVGAIVL